MQNTQENQWANPEKNAVVTNKHTNWATLGLFGPLLGKQEFSKKIQLCQFWVIMVPQLHAKYKKKQWANPEKSTDVNRQEHKSGNFDPFGMLSG